MRMRSEFACRDVVELVTLYVEGGLSDAERTRFEEHIVMCDGCSVYLDQMRETARLAGALGASDAEEALSPAIRNELMHAFRDWKSR